MGLKIKIFSPGKIKESWLKEALHEYEKRLTGVITIEWDFVNLPSEPPFMCLDPKGEMLSSTQFSTFLYKEFEKMGSRLNFVIGASQGLPHDLLDKASSIISLSKMTFTYQHTRLFLLEQIYRASQIEKRTLYHK